MRGKEIVAAIMELTGTTNAVLAHKLETSIATMWDRINSKKTKDISVSTMNEMVRAMDYKIIVVPLMRPVRKDEFEVTSDLSKKAIAKKSGDEE